MKEGQRVLLHAPWSLPPIPASPTGLGQVLVGFIMGLQAPFNLGKMLHSQTSNLQINPRKTLRTHNLPT